MIEDLILKTYHLSDIKRFIGLPKILFLRQTIRFHNMFFILEKSELLKN